MPTLTHLAHDHTKAESTRQVFTDESGTATRRQATVTETVEARFEVLDLPDFQYGRSETSRRMHVLRLIFQSENGSDWVLDNMHSTASAHNVLKGGDLGAMVTVTWFDLPRDVQQLARNEAVAWVNEAHPRERKLDLTPRQLVTLLGHQVRQAHAEFDEDGTAANARELAAKLLAYADAVDAN